ncbi:hypothetical protein FQZ97_1046500 [compost metagenome]
MLILVREAGQGEAFSDTHKIHSLDQVRSDQLLRDPLCIQLLCLSLGGAAGDLEMVDGQHATSIPKRRQAITAGMASALEHFDESVEENHRPILAGQIHEGRTMREADALQPLGSRSLYQLPGI